MQTQLLDRWQDWNLEPLEEPSQPSETAGKQPGWCLLRERQSALTADGIELFCRRYCNPGGAPVLVVHGMGQNANGWDHQLPQRSLARHLASLGYDVWLANLRGHGRPPFRSGQGRDEASLEDYAALDVPALISLVRRETGRKPVLVGHSMGGVAILLYLGGVVIEHAWVMRQQRHGHSLRRRLPRARLCPRRARLRTLAVAGAVAVGAPVVTQPASVFKHLQPFINKVLSLGFQATGVGNNGSKAVRQSQTRQTASPLTWPARLLGRAARQTLVRLALSPLAGIAWNPENMDQQSVTAELQDTLDDVSLTAIRQFEDWFSRGEMRARHHDGDEQPPAPFASVFEQLDVPLLFLNGTLDPWAPPAQLESIWERIPSARKERIALAGFGHNDLRMGNLAAAEVFPRIARFLVQTGSITARP